MRKTIYSPRVIYNAETNTMAIFIFDYRLEKINQWLYFDGRKVERTKGKLKYPKGFIEVAYFDEGDL